MATALDVVGERWALLLVRELMLGSRSFTQLAGALPGIGTDTLTARLRNLEGAGIIERSGATPRRRYVLTADGKALRGVLTELARWGATRLAPPATPADVSTRTLLTALLLDSRAMPGGLDGDYEITCGDDTARFSVDGPRLDIHVADQATPGLTAAIELTPIGLRGLIVGEGARRLVRDGHVTISGHKRRATALLDTLATPPALTEALRKTAQ